jgi:hypothetical protein
MGTRLYVGKRSDAEDGSNVMVHDGAEAPRPLHLYLEEVNHSPTGFEWGYGGSGPAQLAFAILADCTGSTETARQHYQGFKQRHIATIHTDEWCITSDLVRQFLDSQPKGGLLA